MSQNMKNLEQQQKRAAKKDARNARVESRAIDDPTTLFGRAEKALGDGWFNVIVQNEDHRMELTPGLRARIAGKSVAFIRVNDILILGKCGRTYEIFGAVNIKNAKKLVKEQRIPAHLINSAADKEDDEGGIEFDHEGEQEEPSTADADIDVDAI